MENSSHILEEIRGIENSQRFTVNFPFKHKISLYSCPRSDSVYKKKSGLLRFGLVIYINAARMITDHTGLSFRNSTLLKLFKRNVILDS